MSDPDQIRYDIERTRAELGSDVDALADKVTPSKIAHRQTEKVKSAMSSVKDRVMGSAHDVRENVVGSAHDVGASGRSAIGSVGEAISDAPHRAAQSARGNPLAVGLIALGAGWLLSSLLPTTRVEQEAASRAKDAAAPVADKLKDVARETAENLREPAQDAMTAVKETATEAMQNVKEEGTDAASGLKDQATEAKHTVQDGS
jgi:ElaB/YqjD/DUF883 family membrane-anchored ribosome-binding protein